MKNEQLALIPESVSTLAGALGIRIDGIWPATAKTVPQIALTAREASRLDPNGYAVGASFAIPLPSASPRALVAKYIEVVTRFSPETCPCRKAHEALDRATYVAPVILAA